jgi:SAM-dependent methyltransferase
MKELTGLPGAADPPGETSTTIPSTPQGEDATLDISVVIPCLNEARTIRACVDAAWQGIRAAELRGEVIVADNGSTDGSRELAEQARARVVAVPRRGYGAALQAGFTAARGRLLMMGDADLSYDFTEIPRFVEEQRRSRADIVVGDRLGGRIKRGAMPWTHHHIGNPLISFTIRRLFGVPLNDCYCGLRLLTRDAHRRLRLNAVSMEFALEMIVQGSLLGLRFSQVPITLHVDGRDHAPHLKTVRDGYRSFRFLFQHAPITSYGIAGTAALVMGVALLGRALWVEAHGEAALVTASAASALLLTAWTLGVLGIIARVFSIGFLGNAPDPQLRSFFRFAHLETGVALSAIVFIGGAVLAATMRAWPALFQLGLTMCVTGLGTFIASFVVSLIGRAMPDNRLAATTPPGPSAAASQVTMAAANPETGQNDEYSLGTQDALSHAGRYNAWLADSLRGAWGESRTVLDVGCSIGNVTHIVADRLRGTGRPDSLVVGVEIISEAADRFRERFGDRDDLLVVTADFTDPPEELARLAPFDCAVSFNVLEHIDDDVAALASVRRLLKPGGRIGLLVPGGGDALYGVMDADDRHFRRYTPGRLEARLEAAGFEVLSIRRVNMVGALLWYVKGRVLRSSGHKASQLRLFDRLVPFLRRLDAVAGPPVGQSLAAVARVPNGAADLAGPADANS